MSGNVRTDGRQSSSEEVYYPESNGMRLAENTEQFDWIVLLVENFKALFADQPNVFVAGDLLWYPVKGRADICFTPDVMVAFGRPMGYRSCYKQWEEAGVAPHVAFEILSPSNTPLEMLDKLKSYDRYGVEEYYLYDPEAKEFRVWLRRGDRLEAVEDSEGFQSPRLRVRFWLTGDGLKVERPDGTSFESYLTVWRRASGEHETAERERHRADQERERAERERERAERLARKLRELGLNPDE